MLNPPFTLIAIIAVALVSLTIPRAVDLITMSTSFLLTYLKHLPTAILIITRILTILTTIINWSTLSVYSHLITAAFIKLTYRHFIVTIISLQQ